MASSRSASWKRPDRRSVSCHSIHFNGAITDRTPQRAPDQRGSESVILPWMPHCIVAAVSGLTCCDSIQPLALRPHRWTDCALAAASWAEAVGKAGGWRRAYRIGQETSLAQHRPLERSPRAPTPGTYAPLALQPFNVTSWKATRWGTSPSLSRLCAGLARLVPSTPRGGSPRSAR
jgi:hypothetical protein